MKLSSVRLAHHNCNLPSLGRAGDRLASSCFSSRQGFAPWGAGVLSPWAEASPLSLGQGSTGPAVISALALLEACLSYCVANCQPVSLAISNSRPTGVARAVFIPQWSRPRHPSKAQVLPAAQRPWILHQNHSAPFPCCQHTQLGT